MSKAKREAPGVVQVALGTQILGIACSADGTRLRATRIARGGKSGSVELDALSLEVLAGTPATKTAAKKTAAKKTAAKAWLPVATVDAPLQTRTRSWVVGEYGRGLFVRTLAGKQVEAPEPFNDATLTVTAFAVSADEKSVLVGNSSGWVSVFDAASGEERWGQRIHRGHVTAAGFSPDGSRIYTGSAGGVLCAVAL